MEDSLGCQSHALRKVVRARVRGIAREVKHHANVSAAVGMNGSEVGVAVVAAAGTYIIVHFAVNGSRANPGAGIEECAGAVSVAIIIEIGVQFPGKDTRSAAAVIGVDGGPHSALRVGDTAGDANVIGVDGVNGVWLTGIGRQAIGAGGERD